MCNGNDIGNLVMQDTECCNLLCLGRTYFFIQNSCHFTEVWDNGIMTVLGVRKWCSFFKLLDRDPWWQQYWLGQHIKDTHEWRNWHWKINMSYIKIESDNVKKFKLILQKYLYKNSFYSLDEDFELQKNYIYIWCKLVFQSCILSIGWFPSIWISRADVLFHLHRWCVRRNIQLFPNVGI